MTLTEFLLARIAEDEAAAQSNDWLAFEYGVDSFGREKFSARVLAECEAKRRIVELHDVEAPGRCRSCGGFVSQTTPRGIEHSGYDIPYPCPTIRTLAAVYADHPDYREEWKP